MLASDVDRGLAVTFFFISRSTRNHLPIAMSSITMQLDHYRASLAEAVARGEEAMARKIEQQISELEAFRVRHPDIPEAPSPFEVFCDLNPSDINCRVYDD